MPVKYNIGRMEPGQEYVVRGYILFDGKMYSPGDVFPVDDYRRQSLVLYRQGRLVPRLQGDEVVTSDEAMPSDEVVTSDEAVPSDEVVTSSESEESPRVIRRKRVTAS